MSPDPVTWKELEYAQALQRKYREKRRKWAKFVNRPYNIDIPEPDPGVIDAADRENG